MTHERFSTALSLHS